MSELTFEQYVDAWDAKAKEIAKLKAKLKPLEAAEMQMRKAIEVSLKAAIGDELKEGVNDFTMVDGRTIKYTYSVERKISDAEVKNAREAYDKQNDKPVVFDQLLRVKYELDKKNWDTLSGPAKVAVSCMITAKPKAPTLEIV